MVRFIVPCFFFLVLHGCGSFDDSQIRDYSLAGQFVRPSSQQTSGTANWFTKSLRSSASRPTQGVKYLGSYWPGTYDGGRGVEFAKPVKLSDGSVVVNASNGYVYWFKGRDLLHKASTGGIPHAWSATSSPAVLSDDTIVVGSGYVSWFKDGRLVFRFHPPRQQISLSSPAVLDDGTIVIGSTGGYVHWLKDGVEKFRFTTTTEDDVRSSPAVLADGTVVVGSNDSYVYWLRDGKEIFRFKTGGRVTSSPAVLSDGTVVIGSDDWHVYWLRDGKEIFKFKTGGAVMSSPSLLSDDSVVIMGEYDDPNRIGYDFMFMLKDGQEIRKISVGGGPTYFIPTSASAAVLSDDTIVTGSRGARWYRPDGSLYNLEHGEGSFVLAGTPLVLTDGTVIRGTTDGRLTWYDAR